MARGSGVDHRRRWFGRRRSRRSGRDDDQGMRRGHSGARWPGDGRPRRRTRGRARHRGRARAEVRSRRVLECRRLGKPWPCRAHSVTQTEVGRNRTAELDHGDERADRHDATQRVDGGRPLPTPTGAARYHHRLAAWRPRPPEPHRWQFTTTSASPPPFPTRHPSSENGSAVLGVQVFSLARAWPGPTRNAQASTGNCDVNWARSK